MELVNGVTSEYRQPQPCTRPEATEAARVCSDFNGLWPMASMNFAGSLRPKNEILQRAFKLIAQDASSDT